VCTFGGIIGFANIMQGNHESGITIIMISTILTILLMKLESRESERTAHIEKTRTEILENKTKAQKDILMLMFENMDEIREYFAISKKHVKFSFWLTVLSCFFGGALLTLAVYHAMVNPDIQPAIIAFVAGAVVELFAATSLVVHKKSIGQLNYYYNALHNNEMFLSTVNLVSNLKEEKQDDTYIKIIENELNVRLSQASSFSDKKQGSSRDLT